MSITFLHSRADRDDTPMPNDLLRAIRLVGAAGGHDHDVQVRVIEGEPPSKARPRLGRGGNTYTPAKTVAGEKRIAAGMRSMEKRAGNVALACLFYRSTLQRIDVDNLLKAVLDGATRAQIWDDDSQVTAVLGVLEHDPERPRTVVALSPHTSSMLRGVDAMLACEVCGTLYLPGGKRRAKARYCSRACMVKLTARECERCGIEFQRRAANQRFCSADCRLGALHDASRTRGPKPDCEVCGKPLSRHGYKRCRDCFESGAT